MERIKTSKRLVTSTIIAILLLTALEFPAPIGFETRPQSDVSPLWLMFFLIIAVSELAVIPLIYKHPKSAAKLGILVGILNILQVLADQFHLIQPELATVAYSLLEYMVVLMSFALIYFSNKLMREY